MTTTPSTATVTDLFAASAKQGRPPMYGAAQQGRAPLTSFSYGLADPTMFPSEEIVDATSAVLAEDADAALNYGMSYRGLTQQIIERLAKQGVTAEPDEVMVSYGSGQILGLLPRVFIDPGDTVIIEGPSFMGAVRQFSDGGARLVTVPVDDKGLDTDALEAILADLKAQGIRPKFIYTIPTFHNPSGATMTLERRKKLVALAAEYGVLIVEDDAYYDLRFEGQPVPTLASLDTEGWVLRLCTYSKILAPGVRVGWAYGNKEIISRLEMMRSEGGSSPFTTRVVAKFAENGRLEQHIKDLNERYRYKRDLMLEAIATYFPKDVTTLKPEGGFFIWCTLPPDISATKLLKEAEDNQGVTFTSGTRCFANGQGDNAIRLAFSFLNPDQITDGIKRLGAAMEAVRGG